MDKILVSIYVLTIGEEYDIYIPINEKVSDIISLIQNSVREMSGNYYQINTNAMLYSGIDGNIINSNNIVKFSGLTNGARLLLIWNKL